ncbi:helix-turn-helix domain-containing protein [Oscillatoria sp. CS-180]|uniref:helix-turn-helix domain-containing protein n=1 Tax=Oscillatoria sp. CS-180 TaxID=3021720 RepID=UPI00232D180D|nr:helix-turn-helix domain-containing protein [Oscillatoria sp. CS-180]MDB9528126.1 helix-turn-helix domain-containing protein [Oscillatoria sp. CS-180]
MKTPKSDPKLSSASEYALIFGAGVSAAASLAAQQVAAASLPVTALVALGLVNRRRLDQQIKEGHPQDSRLEEQSTRDVSSGQLKQQVTASPLPEIQMAQPLPEVQMAQPLPEVQMAQPQVTPRRRSSRIDFSRRRPMDADKERLVSVQKDSLQKIGAYLYQTRQKQGLSLQDIHQKTFIQRYALKAIEAGDLDTLPEPFYVRAFIHKYAVALGLIDCDVAADFPVF